MRIIPLLFAAAVLVGCTSAPGKGTPTGFPEEPTPTLPPSPTIRATAQPTDTPAPDHTWQPLVKGMQWLSSADGLTAVRHQPVSVRYQTEFETDPAGSRSVGEWLSSDERANAAVNCGFYRDDGGTFAHIGLLMTNGDKWANLRKNWGAVLIVRDGSAHIIRRPQRLQAPATLGIQGWPMLVQGSSPIRQLNDVDVARRTAVGIDSSGRIVWVVDSEGSTLAEFSRRLLDPMLNIVDALNLDGGISSGLRIRSGADNAVQGPESFPIPCALRLQPKL